MPKKGKGKKGPELLVDDEALAPFEVKVNDMIKSPLGVVCTVMGVKDGQLIVQWPGGAVTPAAPGGAVDKAGLKEYGYSRRPQSAHIQRSIDERVKAQYMQRRYGAPGPKTAAMRLPLGPGSAAFQMYASGGMPAPPAK